MTTFNQPKIRAVQVAGFAFLLVLAGVYLVFGINRGSTAQVWGSAAFIAFLLYGTWRTWRVAVVLTDEGIEVRNHMRDRKLKWDEIEGAELRSSSGFIARDALYLRLKDGKAVPCDVYKGSPADDEAIGKTIVEAINARSVDR